MRAVLALLVLGAVAPAGCGEEEPAATAADGSGRASYRLADAENALQGSGLALVRDGEARIAPEVEPRPYESARLAARGGAEFEVLVSATARQARRVRDDVADTDPSRP